ncbi:MAG: heme exporter protein CcmB [Nitrospinae bacterium]|nr:heme exporter protein CcmB [Nitrospinota bacterium]
MNEILRTAHAILLKDMKTEFRSREFLGHTFMFALLVIVIFNFAFKINPQNTPELASGILWIAFLFAGTLGLGRSFLIEKENDCIQGLGLSPVDRTAIFIAKFLGNLFFLAVIQIMTIPVFIVLYNLNVMEHFTLQTTVFLLGDIGFMTLGTLIAAMSVNLKAREILLPVLLLPLLVPLLIFAASATAALLTDGDPETYMGRLKLLAAYDVIFFVVSALVFEYIMDEL